MSIVTKPTVGRKVWFFASAQHALENAAGVAEAQPFDATVIFVHDDRTVNLRVTNPFGESGPVLGATLRQDGDPPINGPHAQWMPYQVKQAEKHATTAAPSELLQSAIPHEVFADKENNEGDLVDNSGTQALKDLEEHATNTAEKSVDSPGDKL